MKKQKYILLVILTLMLGTSCSENEDLISVKVGDFIYGGVVFYVDPDDDTKGLVCAIEDLGKEGAEWGCRGTDIPNANGQNYYDGMENTIAIKAACATDNTAAKLCFDYIANGYSDWYLPSRTEMNEIYENREIVNATAVDNEGDDLRINDYWTSSNRDQNYAWIMDVYNGKTTYKVKNNNFLIRPVRKF
ncbi:DUF1566 domain-containing protein [Polaribacter ponticola]|uniref:DUF1566 domain-containing protein n=1 Tax=Polaribacter ponticola TaxID=2978475 RepID=A0ABT5S524_9FLAO|nr:DUF1566 domain-containing protein [Polaribacter sp. MSW5]MDD7913212.1 DUF1566 domain-containing protein [Polaribacter sp. MSW5]